MVTNKKIAAPIKYLSNFWRLLEMLLIRCKIHIELNWTKDGIISNFDSDTKFNKTDTEHFVLISTFSTRDKEKLTK